MNTNFRFNYNFTLNRGWLLNTLTWSSHTFLSPQASHTPSSLSQLGFTFHWGHDFVFLLPRQQKCQHLQIIFSFLMEKLSLLSKDQWPLSVSHDTHFYELKESGWDLSLLLILETLFHDYKLWGLVVLCFFQCPGLEAVGECLVLHLLFIFKLKKLLSIRRLKLLQKFQVFVKHLPSIL